MLSRIFLMCATTVILATTAQSQTTDAAAKVQGQTNQTVKSDADSKEGAVLDRFKQRFGNLPINNIRETPYGLFELQIGTELVYTDEAVRFVLDGRLIDAQTREDVTQKRLDDLAKVDFEKLPFDLAFKQVRGDGSRRIAVFEDPNCGYCKQLRKNMEGIDDLTIYTFMFPILSTDSTLKVRNIWCADNPGAVWDDWMLRGKVPANLECDAPIEGMLEAGRQLLVQGTPAIFFEDGSRVPGAISKEELLTRLN